MTRAELPLHRRTITLTAHEEDGDEISVEAVLSDERPRVEPPVRVVHRMALEVRIRLADMVVVHADADMRTFPHAECPLITPVFDALVGLSVAAGYNRAIQERFRGVSGCSHLYELARALGGPLSSRRPSRPTRAAVTPASRPMTRAPRRACSTAATSGRRAGLACANSTRAGDLGRGHDRFRGWRRSEGRRWGGFSPPPPLPIPVPDSGAPPPNPQKIAQFPAPLNLG
ncbi:DUF2889 domain-containing protein, partial [Streptomyces sp. NPDC058656]